MSNDVDVANDDNYDVVADDVDVANDDIVEMMLCGKPATCRG